jgi:hypothetical protein
MAVLTDMPEAIGQPLLIQAITGEAAIGDVTTWMVKNGSGVAGGEDNAVSLALIQTQNEPFR